MRAEVRLKESSKAEEGLPQKAELFCTRSSLSASQRVFLADDQRPSAPSKGASK